ncbi:pyruvate, phosphate dikinase [Paraconexibacter antarcticus]|uniref:Pyruvate, phosphate dikinase n=1 Tax=Paraconexibacter antarcticus TaxID=2949664 RepID=A0ABY5DMF0_9ACTN|nr:pyruvate, phosphate dikinase [Paraconexibacter antarcticus]UTI62590.1 pyruvate, phosphate dikinase [Paraconexibacter antarcticus]
MSTSRRWVQDFSEGSREQRDLLGGKGANVAEMTRILGADRVPAGFTITTAACVAYMEGGSTAPEGMDAEVAEALARLEAHAGKRLGDAADPLLVSVRSGARESMPGMMDTVLNLGLNDASVGGLAERTGNARFAWDSYRRFVQMYGNVVLGIDSDRFEEAIAAVKAARGVELDTDLDAAALEELTRTFQTFYAFPQDPHAQLDGAIRAVFDSWMGDRAVTYRRLHRIPDDWGTAVNVQQMVFGNKGDTSGSGVAFSRDEVTGEAEPSGDFLVNAQGEDVVSGVRNTQDIRDLRTVMPEAHAQLMEILRTLEAHYKDMQDTEFTVEEGRLYMLQTRSAKRPAQAAVRFAVDAVAEGLLTEAEALMTIDAASVETLLSPQFDPSVDYAVVATGIGASPGGAKGEVVFSAAAAVAARAEKRDTILVRPFTDAGDVAGFAAARGILTSTGGKASHAALVARGMGRPAVTGASALKIDVRARVLRLPDGSTVAEGGFIAINGTTGEITLDDVPVTAPGVSDELETVLGWADGIRRLGVRANADTPDDAARAVELGAQGIGLCRSEHMFLGERQPLMAAVILADGEQERTAAIERLRPLQEDDYERILVALDGRPLCVRLLDPPLNEFLPEPHELPEGSPERARVESLQEENPMLGTRGVRLGILQPELYEMQVRALFRAAARVPGADVEVMIPLVDYELELDFMEDLVARVADEEGVVRGRDYKFGSMIELPRACFLADRIARHADFFSFGTNDLTQTGLGFSREDIEARILERYIDVKILDRSPFETIDTPGVAQMVRMGAWLGRKTKVDLKLGVCGEHGGDPDSIAFFHDSGIDYVSCSPPRVPVARLAAAQAAIADRRF